MQAFNNTYCPLFVSKNKSQIPQDRYSLLFLVGHRQGAIENSINEAPEGKGADLLFCRTESSFLFISMSLFRLQRLHLLGCNTPVH